MNKILCLIAFLIISSYANSQTSNFKDITVRNSIKLKDSTVKVIGKDTLTSPAMVRKLISEGAGYTSSNGITKVGSDFQAGGTLTKNTWYNGNSYDFSVGQPASQVNNFDIWSSGTANINSNIFKITIPSYEWNFTGKTITGSDSDYLIYNTRLVDYVTGQQKSTPFIFLYENQGVTADARPGVGFYATNNATPSLITEFYIDDFDQNSADKHNFIQLADTGSYFYVQEKGITSSYYMYQVNYFVDNSGWTTYNVDYKFSTGTITQTDNIELVLEPNNNRGSGGLVDSIYIKGQNEWISNKDTIYKVDTSNYSYLAEYALKADSSAITYSAETLKVADNASGYHTIYNNSTGNAILKIQETYSNASIELQGDEGISVKLQDVLGDYLIVGDGGITGNGANLVNLMQGSDYIRISNGIDIVSNNGITIDNNSSADIRITTVGNVDFGSSDIASVDTITSNVTITNKIETDTIKTTGEVNIITGPNEYKFKFDTLHAENEVGKFKRLISKIFKTDTIIIGSDSLVGGIDAKTAIESINFAQLNFKDTSFTTHAEGRMFFDQGTKTHSFQNDISGFTHQLGENNRRVYNNTGTTLQNGKVVRRTGSYINGSRVATVAYSGCTPGDSARMCGVLTTDIAPGEYGMVTSFGEVNFLNTLGKTGEVYLGHNGEIIDTPAPPPFVKLEVGYVTYTDNDSGSVSICSSNKIGREKLLIPGSTNVTSIGYYYSHGFYRSSSTSVTLTQASPTVTFGNTDSGHGSHPFIVTGGAGTVNTGVVGLRVTGTTITDQGTYVTTDADTILTDITITALNNYFEGVKFLGIVTYELIVISGSPTSYSLTFNYGQSRYEDNQNRDFYVTGINVYGRAGASDTGFDMTLFLHDGTGWTYAASGFVAGGTIIARRSVDLGAKDNLVNGAPFSWKRDNLSEFINGTRSEGIVIRYTTTANNAVSTVNTHIYTEIEE